MRTAPPVHAAGPRTVNGSRPRPSSSTATPAAAARRAAWPSAVRGRTRSPSKVTAPSASAASGGTKRITVPASPVSKVPRSGPGVTNQSRPGSSIVDAERAQRRRHQPVSRARSGRLMRDGPVGEGGQHEERGWSCDFDPGSWTVAWTASCARGAGHACSLMAHSLPDREAVDRLGTDRRDAGLTRRSGDRMTIGTGSVWGRDSGGAMGCSGREW